MGLTTQKKPDALMIADN